MEKIWLEEYPEGVPAEIDLDSYSSLKQMMEECFTRFPDRPAWSNMGKTLSYAELDALSRNFGAFLADELRLPRGARIAIMLPNILQYPVAAIGALRAGYTVVNVNPLYTARELRHQLADSEASAILILDNFAHTLEKVIKDVPIEHTIVARVGDLLSPVKGMLVNIALKYVKKAVPAYQLPNALTFKHCIARGKSLKLPDITLDHNDIAFLQYTGGTTGVAKGAVLTHGNMVANVLQATAWISASEIPQSPVIITALPLYHIFSLTANCLTFMHLGAENVLITNPRDMPAFLKTMSKTRFNAITGVNTLFNSMLNAPGFDQLDFSHLSLTLGGGMAVQESVAKRWKEVTGCTLVEAYGLTETSPAACMNPITLEAWNGTIGLPIPSTEASIRNDEGQELPMGKPGELCLRGPQVMREYWKRPEDTAEVLSKDGWLRTGDVGIVNEKGYIKLVDRIKDMILVSGFNVYPNEIENVAAMHPGVLEVAALGVPNEKSGEMVKLFVVKKDPALDEKTLIAFCREQLTAYKVPRSVEFRDDLPKSNVGKILRRELRED